MFREHCDFQKDETSLRADRDRPGRHDSKKKEKKSKSSWISDKYIQKGKNWSVEIDVFRKESNDNQQGLSVRKVRISKVIQIYTF